MNICILGYRVAGLDGVSLECVHWKNILEGMGHKVTFVAGELDREGIVLPDLHFKYSKVAEIHNRVVYGDESFEKVEKSVFTLAGDIEGKLRKLFRSNGKVDLLIVPNVFSLPIHFPLSIALARVIHEFGISTIARHHDFWWERDRYNKSKLFDFYKKWFPPTLPEIKHTVINSVAQHEIKERFGIDAPIISDSFDFTHTPKIDKYSRSFRKVFGIAEDDIVFLQATRIVPRKRIELSIDLIAKLNDSKAILVVTGTEGDEKAGYLDFLKKHAKEKRTRVKFIGEHINSIRKLSAGKRVFTLWDAYVNADFVTYPTELEGFGNQFIESLAFKKPVIVTPYEIYKTDIQPIGFNVIEMGDKVNGKVVNQVSELMQNKDEIKKMVDSNFKLGKKYFSYEATAKKISKLIKS